MKLIPNARRAWRFVSVQALAVVGVLQLVGERWESLPPAVQAVVPQDYIGPLTFGAAVVGLVGRLVRQPRINPEENP